MPTGPVQCLLPTLEAHGIVCIYRNLSALRIPALLTTAEHGQTLLFLDSSAPQIKLAGAIVHELGHWALGDQRPTGVESDADAFAAAFLMPGREVINDKTLGPGLDLAQAATIWGVPTRALARRLRELRQITERQLRDLIRDTKELGANEGRKALLGAPSTLVETVRSAGGSHAAASKAFLSVEQLRNDYLARSGR